MGNNLIKIKRRCGGWTGIARRRYGFAMDELTFRPYRADDFTACLALFDGNTPEFFAAYERAEFLAFLREIGPWPYFVCEVGGQVVACGGFEVAGSTASLTFGMVDRARQGQGLGQALTRTRLKAIRAAPGVERVVIETSQLSAGFYDRLGFRVTEVTENGFAPGLDRWVMVLDL